MQRTLIAADAVVISKEILPIVIMNSSSPIIKEKTEVCPVTGLTITQKPEWSNIDLGEGYSVSFRLIGERILLSIPIGNSGKNGMKRLVQEREKFLKEMKLYDKKHVQIKDYSGVIGATTREGREQFLALLIEERERGNLLGFWGFDSTWFIKLVVNVGIKFNRQTYPVRIVNNYKEAVENAVRVLKENNLISTVKTYQRETRDDWCLDLDGYSVKFETFGNDIVYTEAYGFFKKHHVEPFFNLHKKVLMEINPPEGRYYRIGNWGGIKKSTWKARTLYIEELKKINASFPCIYSVLFGLNRFMSVLTNLSKQFIPFTIVTAHNLEEALEFIERKKHDKILLKEPEEEETKTVFVGRKINRYIEDLFQFIITINWNQAGINVDSDKIDDTHPFKSLYESITLIKQDFDANLQERNKAVEVLKENEERFRIMFESSHDLISITDLNDNVKWANASWRKTLGYTPETLPEPFEKIHPDDQQRVRTAWELMKQGRGNITNLEYRYKTVEDLYLYLETTVRRLNTSSENLLFVISHDITERVKAEEEKLLLEEQLRQSEKIQAIGQLAGGIAHDFNNQLAGIMGYTDVMRRRISSDKHLYNYIDKIQKVVKRAGDLTSQLLAFARKGKYQSVPVNIHDIIKEVISILEHSIDKRITIRQNLQADTPMTIGDQSQLQNVFLNLTINARDAMPEGGELTFSTEVVTLDEKKRWDSSQKVIPGEYILIGISDTGMGMNEETRKHIYEPFFTTKRQGEGTGMGLAAVYGTIKSHNGLIEVISKVDKGTTFKVYLPVSGKRWKDEGEIRSPMGEIDSSASLLFVDDEEMVVDIATDILSDLGYKVTTCMEGNEAVTCYKKVWKNTDLVILDLVMPGLSGKDIFRAMKKINPDIKVILSSGYSIDGEAQSILDEGALSFIQKPYRIDALLEKIAEAFK